MSAALDVGIGLVLLYLLLALMVTTLQELVSTALGKRAKHLFDAIAGMLETAEGGGKSLAQQVYAHPLVRNLVNEKLELVGGQPPLSGKGLPSYIPSKTFALALIDVLRQSQKLTAVTGADRVLASASEVVTKLPSGQLKDTLSLLLSDTERFGDDIDKRAAVVSDRIEGWFNDRMARASGWYKRKAQVFSLAMAFGVTALFNADSVYVTYRLWHDVALRDAVVAAAQAFDKTTPGSGLIITSGLPIGWHGRAWDAFHCIDYAYVGVGWLITTLAVSLGAGFWFDVLSKALQIRGSGLKVSAATGVVGDAK